MLVRDVMTTDVKVIEPKTTLAEAARILRDEDIGMLPIGGQRLEGTVTDRDLVVRGIANDVDPVSTPVEKLMSAEVLYCFDDQDCAEVARNMGEQKVRRLPVVNREKALVGLVGFADLTEGTEPQAVEAALEGVTH